MFSIFINLDFLKSKIIPINIYLVFYSLILLPIKFNNIIIILVGISWLFLTIKYDKTFAINRLGIMPKLLLFYYLLLLIGLIYTSNLDEGLRHLEVKLSLALFPLFFFTGHEILAGVKLIDVLNHILIAVIVGCLYSHVNVIYDLFSSDPKFFNYTYLNLSQYLNIHPGYLSMYVSFAILICLINFPYYWQKLRYLFIVILAYLFFFNFLLVSRTALFALFVGIILFLLSTSTIKNLPKIIVLSFSTFLFASFLFSNDGKERIIDPLTELFNKNFESLLQEGTLKYRSQIYKCGFDIMSKDKLCYGYGTGAVNDKLFECYIRNNYEWNYSQKANTHSEYLTILLRSGLIGLTVFLIILIVPVVFYDHNLPIFSYFLLLFSIICITENTLSVQKGSVFFGYMYSIFAYYHKK